MTASDSAVPRPNLTQLKRQARELLDGIAAGDAVARERLVRALPALQGDATRLPGFDLKLADAQLAVARENGFASWPKLKAYADSGAGAPLPFLRAVLAVVNGDEETLRSMLAADPTLIHQRSTEDHQAQLLHYVAVNGVENHLQRTPPNAVQICRLLLAAGADVDSPCQTYGGGPNQTTLNLLVSSVWPHKAGLQGQLAEVLIDAGAAVDGPLGDGAPLRTALRFGYTGTAQTLAARGSRVDDLDLAAGLGHVEALDALWSDDLQKGFDAFVVSCRNGQVSAMQRLLDLGVDIDSRPDDGGTGLHEAILWDQPEVVTALLARGADPAIAHGRWGATALDFASYNGRLACVDILLDTDRPAADVEEALVSAAGQAHRAVVRRLLATGVDRTRALEQARESNLSEIVALLED